MQSLLKAELGPGVESWGAHGDHGRDAFCVGPLSFPSKTQQSDGPFVFQVKFVAEANAAGANPEHALLAAIRKEMGLVADRLKFGHAEPAHYVLVTNSPLSTQLRKKIGTIIGKTLKASQVHALGSADVCDLLDSHPNLRRAFPQLLSLRDLDLLIGQAVSHENLERSRSTVDAARQIVAVFVPTLAYQKAWKCLRDHHFVVLEGPPEVGKTAIAWMIALAQISMGWEAIVCDNPEDFFAGYNQHTSQIFVADDAFGRTEYDPSRGSKWERDLSRIYRLLDRTHWLIWTSRRHILERARKTMDLQGEAHSFPSPGAVLVDATNLSFDEKALMLYRHARAAGLEEESKIILRQHVRSVLANPDFTPERIRGFVSKYLPVLAQESKLQSLSPEVVAGRMRDAIRNATDRIAKTYDKLPMQHKWVLISLLESSRSPKIDVLEKSYETHCPLDIRSDRSFEDVLDELTEAFVKPTQSLPSKERQLDWIHPSYRDVVIDQLASNPSLQLEFLANSTLPGIKLALSESGGTEGDRQFPLLAAPGSWGALRTRSYDLVEVGAGWNAAQLLQSLLQAVRIAPDSSSKSEILVTMGGILERVRNNWDESRLELDSYLLGIYCDASAAVTPLPPLPKFDASWLAKTRAFVTALDEAEESYPLNDVPLRDWVEFLEIVRDNEPRFLVQARFPENYKDHLDRLINVVKKEFDDTAEPDSYDDYRGESIRMDAIGDALKKLSRMFPSENEILEELAAELQSTSSHFQNKADRLEEEAKEAAAEEEDMDDDERDHFEPLDVDELFSDL